jgi:transposase
MGRYELTDSEWKAIEPCLPNKPRCVRSALAVAGGFLEKSLGAFWMAKRNNLLSGYVVF